jgi:hypothetical protein
VENWKKLGIGFVERERGREREGGRWGLRGGGGGDYKRLTHGVFLYIIKLQRYRFLVFFFLKF